MHLGEKSFMFYSCFFIFQWLMETTGASLILVSTL